VSKPKFLPFSHYPRRRLVENDDAFKNILVPDSVNELPELFQILYRILSAKSVVSSKKKNQNLHDLATFVAKSIPVKSRNYFLTARSAGPSQGLNVGPTLTSNPGQFHVADAVNVPAETSKGNLIAIQQDRESLPEACLSPDNQS
jgi:hypothetical protein